MKTIIAVILTILVSVAALADSLSITSKTGLPVLTDPRQNNTVILQIENSTDAVVTVKPYLEMPAGWGVIASPAVVTVPASASAISLFSFFVPIETPPGTYVVFYRLKPDSGPETEFSFEVVVHPSIGIEVDLRSAPTTVISGEEPEVVFLITNTSNVLVTAEIELRSSMDFPAQLKDDEQREVALSPRESKEVTVLIKTDASGGKIVRYRLDLLVTPKPDPKKIQSDEMKLPTASDRCQFEVIPLSGEERPDYHSLPVELTAGHFEKIGTDWNGGISIKASGSGYLDQENRHKIDLLALTTLTLPDFVLGAPADTYRLNYSWGPLRIDAGDNSYKVSPLLGTSLYGRGLAPRLVYDKFEIGGFYYARPLDNPVSQFAGFSSAVTVPDKAIQDGFRYRSGVTLLSRLPENLAVDLYQQYRPVDEIHFDLDLASSTEFNDGLSWAALFDARAQYPVFDAGLSAMYGAPGFTGILKDKYHFSAYIATRLLDGLLNLKTGYAQEMRNVSLDVTQNTAPRTRDLYFATNLKLPSVGTSLSLRLETKTRLDMMLAPEFDDRYHIIGFQAYQPIADIKLRWRSEWEMQFERSIQQFSLKHHYYGSMDIVGPQQSSYNIYFDIDAFSSKFYDSTSKFALGLAMSFKISPVLLRIDMVGNIHTREKVFEGLSLYSAINATVKINASNEILTDAQFVLPPSTSNTPPELRFGVYYKTWLNVPVSRRRDAGSLEGTVTADATGTPIEGVIIRVADRAVVTSKDGRYKIATLTEGEYILEADTSRVSAGLIPDRKLPISVVITAGETTETNFSMVQAAAIEGRVDLYAVPEQKKGLLRSTEEQGKTAYEENDLVFDSGYPKVLMEVRNDGEVRRTLTDHNGKFAFPDLRPGQWTLSVAAATLPRYHKIVDGEVSFDVGPGDTKRAVFRIFPIKRPVTIIMQGGSLPLTVKKSGITEKEAGPTVAFTLTSARTASADIEAVARELQNTGLPRNNNKPRLLDLNWGASLDEVERTLNSAGDYSALRYISDAGGIGGAPDTGDEERDILRSATVRYSAKGIGLFELEAEVIVSFLNPQKQRDGLLLSGVELRLYNRDAGGKEVDIENVFLELLTLFWARWRIPVAMVEKEAVAEAARYINTVNDISITYEIAKSKDAISIIYRSDWFDRILSKATD